MPIAITRAISESIQNCELTHLERTVIDLERARLQHKQYEQELRSLGCDLISLPELPDLPDSVFVEDTAVILDEVAIIANPGAASRQPEVESIGKTFSPHRPLIYIHGPATLDGGDVLVVGKKIYVGLGGRSNQEAVVQMQSGLSNYGYEVVSVEMQGCLHLKSAVTSVAPQTLLVNPDWVNKDQFSDVNFIAVDESEPCAANGLLIGDAVIYPANFPKTRGRLEEAAIRLILVEADELAKAEGAVTCCSLILN